MEAYDKGVLLGEGTFGKVHQYTSKKVAGCRMLVHARSLTASELPLWWCRQGRWWQSRRSTCKKPKR